MGKGPLEGCPCIFAQGPGPRVPSCATAFRLALPILGLFRLRFTLLYHVVTYLQILIIVYFYSKIHIRILDCLFVFALWNCG